MRAVTLTGLGSGIALMLACGTARAQALPLIQDLSAPYAVTRDSLASVAQVRVLSSGNVVVHDLRDRRVIMYDSTLRFVRVVADTTSATGLLYGSRLGGLISGIGDTTLLVDPASLSLSVLDERGQLVRTIAIPIPRDAQNLIGGPFGTPALDPNQRLVYRQTALVTLPPSGGRFEMPPQPDSAWIVRVGLHSRAVDTVSSYRIPKISYHTVRVGSDLRVDPTVDPIPTVDVWAVLRDGTVAVVRGHDFHVDFVSANGARYSAPRVQFPWVRLTDEDKKSIVDSAEAVAKAVGDSLSAVAANSARDSAEMARPDREATIGSVRRETPTSDPTAVIRAHTQFILPSELADYRPAFAPGAALGDSNGRLWVRTSQLQRNGAVYYVFEANGRLAGRVAVPAGRIVVGFGPKDCVYMGVLAGPIARVEAAHAPSFAR